MKISEIIMLCFRNSTSRTLQKKEFPLMMEMTFCGQRNQKQITSRRKTKNGNGEEGQRLVDCAKCWENDMHSSS